MTYETTVSLTEEQLELLRAILLEARDTARTRLSVAEQIGVAHDEEGDVDSEMVEATAATFGTLLAAFGLEA